jgi:squalene monooxygenase
MVSFREAKRVAANGTNGTAMATGTTNEDDGAWDVVIVGAGVAGASLAHSLGVEGRRVLCVERDLSTPDRIVGELLQPGGYLKLKELGLESCVEGIDAQKVYGYTMFKNGEVATMTYPLEGRSDDVAGRSFHNGRFVQKLRQAAMKVKGVELRQGTVKKLLNREGGDWKEGETVGGVSYTVGDVWDEKKQQVIPGPSVTKTVFAPLTIVCDGHFSSLRSKLSPQASPDHPSHFVGVILKGAPSDLLPNGSHGHVVLGDPSPVLFYPISSTEVRCLVDIPASVKMPSVAKGEMAKYVLEKIVPQVPEQLQPHLIKAVENGQFRSMPNKTMAAKPQRTPGAVMLGDAFNMRHPLTGGGMTVALNDIATFKSMLSPLPDFSDAALTGAKLDEFYRHRTRPALTINTLANALYAVFCSSGDTSMEEMRQACFEYLKLGGSYARGPIALLGGLDPNPLNLVSHFFSVALFGIGRLMVPLPTPERLFKGGNILAGACKIIFPIVKGEGFTRMFFPAWLRTRLGII